jgi:hypothetical protein
MIKQLSAIFASHLYLQWKIPEELNNLRHMVVVLGEQLPLALWVK